MFKLENKRVFGNITFNKIMADRGSCECTSSHPYHPYSFFLFLRVCVSNVVIHKRQSTKNIIYILTPRNLAIVFLCKICTGKHVLTIKKLSATDSHLANFFSLLLIKCRLCIFTNRNAGNELAIEQDTHQCCSFPKMSKIVIT